MKQRILVAVVGVPALLAVLCAAPDWATLALLMGLCIIASHELLAAVLPPEKTRRWWGLAATLAVFVVANVYFSHERFAGTAAAGLMPWLLAALVVVVFLCMVLEYGKKEEMDFTALCAILVAGAAIPLALSCLLRLRMLEHGGAGADSAGGGVHERHHGPVRRHAVRQDEAGAGGESQKDP